jgi:rhodanese-related sulfurtransferase
MFELQWARRARLGGAGALELAPEWVAAQSRSVWVIDVRGREELVGPLGHVPGATWVAFERLPEVYEKLGDSVPVVLVSRTGRRAGRAALYLQELRWGGGAGPAHPGAHPAARRSCTVERTP